MLKNSLRVIAFLSLCVLNSSSEAQPISKHKGIPSQKEQRPPLQDVKSKEIITQFACNANATIFIENVLRRINIRVTNENKVRLVTTVYYQGDPGFTDEEWLQALDLRINGNPGNVVVKSGNLNRPGVKTPPPTLPIRKKQDSLVSNGIALFDSSRQWINPKSNIRRNITIYIPAGSKLDIESKYSDISLDDNIKEVKAAITNGGLTVKDVEKFILTGTYANIFTNNIDKAEVELTNGRFSSKNISTLNINSKNSTVDLNDVKQIKILSNSDQYEIEQAGIVSGQKNYGDLRLTSLKSFFDLSGVNADIKIRSFEGSVSLVKIDDQYADLRLPIGDLKNYSVNFEGTGSNSYTPFEKTHVNDSSFSAKAGTSGPTLFQLKCSNCTVDFK